MPETTTTYDAVLKDFYEGMIRDSLNEKVTLFNVTNAADERVGGRQVMFPVHTNRNWAVGFRAEQGTLPTAQNETYVTATVARKHYYGRIQLTGQVMESSKGNAAAFADAMGETFDRMINTTRRDLNHLLYGIGRGDLATAASAHATESTATFVTAFHSTTGVTPLGDPLRFIEAGMVLDGLNASSAATETTTVVTDFTTATVLSATIAASGTATLTFGSGTVGTATVTIVSGTILVMTGNGWQAFQGLDAGIENSGTYLGISRDARANRSWRGTVDHNNGTLRNLSLSIIQRPWDSVADATGEDDTITHLLCHTSVRREYIDLLQPDIRFAPRELAGGQRAGGLTFTGNNSAVQMMYEVDAPFNSIYGIDARAWHLYKWSDFRWADDDGAILSRATNSTDSWTAFYRCYANFCTDQPRRNFRVLDINATL